MTTEVSIKTTVYRATNCATAGVAAYEATQWVLVAQVLSLVCFADYYEHSWTRSWRMLNRTLPYRSLSCTSASWGPPKTGRTQFHSMWLKSCSRTFLITRPMAMAFSRNSLSTSGLRC